MNNEIRVLHLDDEEFERQLVQKSLAAYPRLKVVSSGTREEAEEAIRGNFFRLALVDLNLDEKNDNNRDGESVLSLLRKNQPQCERVVYSKHHASQIVVDELFQPGEELASSVLDKEDQPNKVCLFVEKRQKQNAFRQHFRILNIEDLAESVARTTHHPANTRFVQEELAYLFDRALLPDATYQIDLPFDPQVAVTDFSDGSQPGFSRSYVGRTQFSLSMAGTCRDGVLAVCKIGKRNEIQEEVSRFRQYINPFVSHTRRVELLGAATAAELGVAIYSYAGGNSPTTMEQLSILLRRLKDHADELKPIQETVEALFDAKELHSVATGAGNIFQYVSSRIQFEPREFKSAVLLPLAEKIMKANEKDTESLHKMRMEGGTSLVNQHGRQIKIPDKLFACHRFRSDFDFCLSHGDLHAGNIFLGGDAGKIVLIDYRYTGAAPRCWDFAVLDCSIRMEMLPCNSSIVDVLYEESTEQRLWKSMWRDGAALGNLPAWAELSGVVMSSLHRVHPDVDEQEYAATLLIWIARLLNLRIPILKKVRLLGWFCFLATIVE